MSDLSTRIANLDPGKRDMLMRRLGKGPVPATALRPVATPAANVITPSPTPTEVTPSPTATTVPAASLPMTGV